MRMEKDRGHMTVRMRMEEDQSHMTERILNLTLEIIYLLTGESFPPVKSGDQVTIMVPPCDSLKPERDNMQKILEVTQKMMELLTGESGNPRDYNLDIKEEFKKEDEKYGVKEPTERCPRPLYSHQDSTQEDLTIPHHHQGSNLGDYNVVLKEEYKEEDEDYGVMTEHSEGHEDPYKDVMMAPPSNGKPPERCPRPLYSHRDPTQEDLTIPHHHQASTSSGMVGGRSRTVRPSTSTNLPRKDTQKGMAAAYPLRSRKERKTKAAHLEEPAHEARPSSSQASSGMSKTEILSSGKTVHDDPLSPPAPAYVDLSTYHLLESSSSDHADDEVLEKSYRDTKVARSSSFIKEDLQIPKKKSRRNIEQLSNDDTPPLSSKGKKPQSERQRCRKFTYHENRALVEQLVPVYEKLIGRYMTTTDLTWKRQQWEKIVRAVNAVGVERRKSSHVKKRYQDIKGTLKKKLALQAEEWTKMGAGIPKQIYLLDYEELLLPYICEESVMGITEGCDTARLTQVEQPTLHVSDVEDSQVIMPEEEEDILASLPLGQIPVEEDGSGDQGKSREQQDTTSSRQTTSRVRRICKTRRQDLEQLDFDREQSEQFHNAQLEQRSMLESLMQLLHQDMQAIHTALVDFREETARFREETARFREETAVYRQQKLELLRASTLCICQRTQHDQTQGNVDSCVKVGHTDQPA